MERQEVMSKNLRIATFIFAALWASATAVAQTATPPAGGDNPQAQPTQPAGSPDGAQPDQKPDGQNDGQAGDKEPDGAAPTGNTPTGDAQSPPTSDAQSPPNPGPDGGGATAGGDTPAATDGDGTATDGGGTDTETIDPDAIPEDDEPGEVIIMTGSRIRTDPLDAPAPILQLDSEQIAKTGQTSVADLLQRLPSSGGALNTRFNSSGNFGFPPDGGGIGAGSAQADLRYLGSKRVLVLVDGVRWVNGSSGSGVPSATDLNTIPIGIIDRIEVLEDGASPIYGSDAIGGVINIITKKNWEGATANAYIGGFYSNDTLPNQPGNFTTGSDSPFDGFTQQYDLTWGQKTDKMSMVTSVYFVEQRRVAARDRAISGYTLPYFDACEANCSSGTPQGRFVLNDPNTGEELDLTTNDGVGGVPFYDPANPTGGDFHGFETIDRFNYAQYNLMVTPSRRFGVFSNVTYKLADRVKIVGSALFNHRESVNQAAPEPLFIGPEAGNGNRMDQISIDVTNPYNPFGFTIDAATNPYFIGRRPIEAGPRLFEQSVNTLYVSGGLQGDFPVGATRFFWDVTAAYGINRADQIKNGGFNSAKLQKALGPIAECEADATCVPFNIFGGQGADGQGTITQEMLDYVTFIQKDVSQQELIDLVANISGDIIKLPAGNIAVAAGVEHRRQAGFFQPDSVVTAGDTAGVPSSPTDGRFQANEAYGEIRIPLASKMSFAKLIDVNAAVRISDFSTFGAAFTLKAGGRWRASDDLLLRGGFAQGYRAPGIGELFGSAARFDQSISDPCSDMLGNSTGMAADAETIANCTALGVPADGSYQQFNQQISVTTGGNRDLNPETSNSYTIGLVYSPTWLEKMSRGIDSLNFEFTYYNIELANAIQAVNAQVQLDQCVQTLDDEQCSGISRTPGGVINGFDNTLTNVGSLRTSGFDVKLTYMSPLTRIGRFRVTSLSSFLNNFTESVPSSMGFNDLPREGTEIGDPERAFPRFKSTLVIDWWRKTDWRASLTNRYINPVREQCRGFVFDLGVCSDIIDMNEELSTNLIAARIYTDVQLTWSPRRFDNLLDLTVGINNLFDRDPPACFTCALNGFDATTYDVPGMFGYVKAGYRMW